MVVSWVFMGPFASNLLVIVALLPDDALPSITAEFRKGLVHPML